MGLGKAIKLWHRTWGTLSMIGWPGFPAFDPQIRLPESIARLRGKPPQNNAMRYLIAPDKFKGTLSAQEVGRIVAEVACNQDPGATVDILPIADGGEGTAALLAVQLGAQPRSLETVDAGIGIAAALGYEFYDANDRLVEPIPAYLDQIAHIKKPAFAKATKVVGLADVETKLLGKNGAIYTFGPQKGLNPEQVHDLDLELARFVDLVQRELEVNHAAVPRAGAAVGLGYGIITFLNATLVSGFAVVAERLKLRERIAAADIVITGEGKLDSQSLEGKGPFGVASIAKACAKPVWVVAGTVSPHPEMTSYFDRMVSLVGGEVTLEAALANPAETLKIRARGLWR